MLRLLSALAAAVSAASLPGCIAWEIRDEIRTANRHLCEVGPALVHTLHAVEQANREIEQTQSQLADVQTQLAIVQAAMVQTDTHLLSVGDTLVQTNPRLHDLDGGLQRMMVLHDVHATLKDVHAAIGPLSKAMRSVGGAMSLLGLGGGEDLLETASPPPAGAPAVTRDAPPVAGMPEPDASEAQISQGEKRADPILGTWVLVYPPRTSEQASPPSDRRPAAPDGISDPAHVLVLQSEGRFVLADDGARMAAGRWTRQSRMLTLALDPAAGASDTPAPPETVELLTLNSRTLTIRRGDAIRVYARP